jgi:teichuronic acid biosynthesis glycosyltransferase TuaC
VNVLVVSRLYPRSDDPVLGIFVEEEVRELSRRCETKVVSPVPWFPPLKVVPRWYAYSQLPRREVRSGVEVLRPRTLILPRNLNFPLLGLSFYRTLRRSFGALIQNFAVDLIHAHMAYPDGFAAVLLGKATGLPIVVSLHGGDVNLYFRRFSGRSQGMWAIAQANRVIAASRSLRDTVVDGYGADPAKVTVIPSGVDVDKFQPMPIKEAESRLDLEPGVPRVLYVGAITLSKGVDYLLKAFARLHPDLHRSAQLVLVGDGDYRDAARMLASDLGIGHRVTWAGKRPNDEIPLWINASDVLVLPSLSEGFGVVLVEALACGKPVVATACGGPEDIVTPETGIMVPPADMGSLADALAAALNNEHRFSGEEIRRYAVDNFAYERVGARILDLYREVLAKEDNIVETP